MLKNIILFFLISAFCKVAIAQTTSTILKEETDIYEKIYNAPLNIVGKESTTLEGLYAQRPVILALIFTRCYGICNPFLVKLKENLIPIAEGNKPDDKPYQILVISFDPYDKEDDMKLLAGRLDLENDPRWIFAVTDSTSRLNQSVSFAPVWDSLRAQFDHDALLVGINRDGYITKKLIGIRERGDVQLLISSVNNVYSPTYRLPNQNMLFSCFNYDPVTGKNKPGLGLIFLALPAVLTAILLISISFMVRRSRQRKVNLN